MSIFLAGYHVDLYIPVTYNLLILLNLMPHAASTQVKVRYPLSKLTKLPVGAAIPSPYAST